MSKFKVSFNCSVVTLGRFLMEMGEEVSGLQLTPIADFIPLRDPNTPLTDYENRLRDIVSGAHGVPTVKIDGVRDPRLSRSSVVSAEVHEVSIIEVGAHIGASVPHINTRQRMKTLPGSKGDIKRHTSTRIIRTLLKSEMTVNELYAEMIKYGPKRNSCSTAITRCIRAGIVVKRGARKISGNNTLTLTDYAMGAVQPLTAEELEMLKVANA